MKKVAILLFGDYRFDGRVQRTAKALDEKFEVCVFVTTENFETYPKIFDGIKINNIQLKSKRLPKHPIVQVIKFIEYLVLKSYYVLKFKPDIILCNDVFTLPFVLLCSTKRLRYVYDSHELWKDTQHKYAYNARLFNFLVWFEKLVIKKFDAVITVGNEIAKEMSIDHNIKKPTVIMNISDNVQSVESSIIRKRLDLNYSVRIVLYVGALTDGRGIDVLIQSCKYWNDNIVLAILGYGELENEYKLLAKKLNVEKKVFFLGFVSQDKVLEYTRSCDAGIMAIQNICLSYYYCLPNKFFQIAHNHKPLLTSNFPELSRIINEYKIGFTFDPSSPKQIAEEVNRLFTVNHSIEMFDFERFHKDFNWSNEKKKLLHVFENIAK